MRLLAESRQAAPARKTLRAEREQAQVTSRPILSAAVAIALWTLAPWTIAAPAVAQDDIVSPITEVERMAEIIGGVHQLRQLCDSRDQEWREQMLALIDLEAQDDDRRQRRMIDAFNAGFRRQEQQRLRCGAESRRVESELAAEGRRLAEQLRDRYLN
jgi:uncharacterized protein (TIGR02301 family)